MPKTVQIRNRPDDVHRTLKARAAREGKSLSDYLLQPVTELAARPSMGEWQARLATWEPMNLREETVAFLHAERHAR